MPNSSMRKGDNAKRTHPGRRSGEGAQSIVPYLRDELATKPQDLTDDQPKPRRSLTSRVRTALRELKK